MTRRIWGNLLIAETARVALGLECVLFVPAGEPWLKSGQDITAGAHRRRMVERAVADNANFCVSDIELRRDGPSYTVDTLRQLRGEFGGDAVLYFIVGSDVLEQFHCWKEPAAVLELCRLGGGDASRRAGGTAGADGAALPGRGGRRGRAAGAGAVGEL